VGITFFEMHASIFHNTPWVAIEKKVSSKILKSNKALNNMFY
jgi:hypothetical protein